ncbi:hypothetical protein [Aestuariibacter sp. A3R04]|uniref:hypothetical protein n=1 Tax=Aestuariibacter sp. A3R04 TaxID=2841571 RepID=UPI001C0A1D83|nr:hypothetical protein [Aestuariibacter sp. A3R04]MBU3023043.1 hypothetical protein [Aestuariibacter sp. A3R04]
MRVEVEFIFPSQPAAYRFLNTVGHLDVNNLAVKRGKTDHHVLIGYQYTTGDFDETASKLDDLAREMGGEECR